MDPVYDFMIIIIIINTNGDSKIVQREQKYSLRYNSSYSLYIYYER